MTGLWPCVGHGKTGSRFPAYFGRLLVLCAAVCTAGWYSTGADAGVPQPDETTIPRVYALGTLGQPAPTSPAKAPRVIADLSGRDTLVVGDSMVLNWPWGADMISLPGQPTARILHALTERIEGRRYDHIVIWAGTAHYMHAYSTEEQYVEHVLAMVAVAKAHANHVTLLGPFPTAWAPAARVEPAFESVRRAAPNVTAVALAEMHACLVAADTLYDAAPDTVHLTAAAVRENIGPLLALGGPTSRS